MAGKQIQVQPSVDNPFELLTCVYEPFQQRKYIWKHTLSLHTHTHTSTYNQQQIINVQDKLLENFLRCCFSSCTSASDMQRWLHAWHLYSAASLTPVAPGNPLLLQCLKRCEERCLPPGVNTDKSALVSQWEPLRLHVAEQPDLRLCADVVHVCTVSAPGSKCRTSICERAQIPPYLRHAWPLILNGDKCCAGSNWGNEKNHFSLPTDQWVPIQLESLKPLAPG